MTDMGDIANRANLHTGCRCRSRLRRNRKMSGFEFVLVVIGAATLTSWLFKAVDVLEGRR